MKLEAKLVKPRKRTKYLSELPSGFYYGYETKHTPHNAYLLYWDTESGRYLVPQAGGSYNHGLWLSDPESMLILGKVTGLTYTVEEYV